MILITWKDMATVLEKVEYNPPIFTQCFKPVLDWTPSAAKCSKLCHLVRMPFEIYNLSATGLGQVFTFCCLSGGHLLWIMQIYYYVYA